MNKVRIAVNICTYKRQQCLENNITKLLASEFFIEGSLFFGGLHIFIVDNASEIRLEDNQFVHLFYNKNTGGSGGFQRGLEEIRKYDEFTHVIFMDDDVEFDISTFYILYKFLQEADEDSIDRPIAGRMLDIDNPNIQWSAAEKWNGGNIEHVQFLRDISDTESKFGVYHPGKIDFNCGAEYGGWWFCCYPMSFAKDNDIMPFFIHCDDVEYGLRCGKMPIIIDGVHVWHQTWEKKFSPSVVYYDVRNSHFVNEKYGDLPSGDEVLAAWKETITKFHLKEQWDYEYAAIKGMDDFLKGLKWLYRIDPAKNHKKVALIKSNRIKNAIYWRYVDVKLRRRFRKVASNYT